MLNSINLVVFNGINLREGKITYNEFRIDLTKSPYDQEKYLQQDLMQIEYGDRYVIDVGWYPMYDHKGFFLIMVIEDYDWSQPLLKLKVKKFENFIKSLQKAIDFLDSYQKDNLNKPYRETWYDFMGPSDGKSDDEKETEGSQFCHGQTSVLLPLSSSYDSAPQDEREQSEDYIAPVKLPATLIITSIGQQNKKKKK